MPDVSFRQTSLLRLSSGLFCGFLASGAVLASHSDTVYPSDQLILQLGAVPVAMAADVTVKAALGQDDLAAARFAAIVADLGIEGLEIERSLDDALLVVRFSAAVSAAKQAQVLELLTRHPDVDHAETDARVFPSFTLNDPDWPDQWYLYAAYGIQAYDTGFSTDDTWDIEPGSAAVLTALLDTGILEHADLDPTRVLTGYDFVAGVPGAADPGDSVVAGDCAGQVTADQPSSWHGLHLAGIMIATANNGIGIAGINHVSPLLPARVLGKCGGYISDVIAAIRWVIDYPMPAVQRRVINLSLASQTSCTVLLQQAIDEAVSAGAIVVAAAGNDDRANVAEFMPAGCNNVITVAATDMLGRVAGYTNLGSRVLLSAPGDSIYSTSDTGLIGPDADTYKYLSGTSASAAQVSAAVSLLLSAQPALTLGNLRQILSETAQPYTGGCPSALGCGAGILDLRRALRAALEITPGDPAAASSGDGGGGGGGGGCVLNPAARPGFDAAWLLLAVFLGLALIYSSRRR